MKEALPVTIVAQLEQLGQCLAAVAREHRDDSLAVLEQAVLMAVREAMPHLLREVIGLSTTNLQPALAQVGQVCGQCGPFGPPQGGQRAPVQSWRSRTIKTVCGTLTFERPWYVCQHCQHGFSPTDQTLALLPRARLSAGFMEWVIESGARTSFADAADEIERLTGLSVAPETVRHHTERSGAELEVTDQQAQRLVAKTQEAAEPVEAAPGQLVVETDGVMVRYLDGWHEVKLGLVGGLVDGELRAKSYVAAREGAEVFGPRLLTEAARRGALEVVGWTGPVTGQGLAQLRRVAVLGDGASWIWNLASAHFGERIEIVDFYHASEHIWTLAKALHGEGTQTSKAWAVARLKELREQGATPVLDAIETAKADTEAAAEVVRKGRGYFHTNAARMAYPDFAAEGLPLGSGAVESSARHLVQLRMKRSGARWSECGGQAVLSVRCRLLSGRSLAA